MPRNVEIKARVRELGALERRVAPLADSGPEDLLQTDVFFPVPAGRLKLRHFADGSAELIQYHRDDQGEPGESLYRRIPTSDPRGLEAALTDALGLRARVVKHRRVYLVGSTRVHLDRVEGLGSFMELEVCLAEHETVQHGERIARGLMIELGIRDEDLVPVAYVDLLQPDEPPASALRSGTVSNAREPDSSGKKESSSS